MRSRSESEASQATVARGGERALRVGLMLAESRLFGEAFGAVDVIRALLNAPPSSWIKSSTAESELSSLMTLLLRKSSWIGRSKSKEINVFLDMRITSSMEGIVASRGGV